MKVHAGRVAAFLLGSSFAVSLSCVQVVFETSEGVERLQTELPMEMAEHLRALASAQATPEERNLYVNLARIVDRFGWAIARSQLNGQERRALRQKASAASDTGWSDELQAEVKKQGRFNAERLIRHLESVFRFKPKSTVEDPGALVIESHGLDQNTEEIASAARAVLQSPEPSQAALDGVVRVVERASGYTFSWPIDETPE